MLGLAATENSVSRPAAAAMVSGLVLVLYWSAVPPAMANMTITLYEGYGTTDGGEIEVEDVGTSPLACDQIAGLAAQPAADFVTFCLERNEDIVFGA